MHGRLWLAHLFRLVAGTEQDLHTAVSGQHARLNAAVAAAVQ